MPLYTYKCETCFKKLDIIKSFKDPAPEVCECGGKLNRDYSAINFKADQGKNDPGSPLYWKRGKSDLEISSVISGEKPPY